jgi:hypothetical protein
VLKFLRRDPAAYITLVQGLLGLALAFHLFGLTAAIVPLIMAVINGASGVVTAILTKRAGFAIAMGLITAVINLFAGYGLTLTDDKTNAILFLSTIALGLFGWAANSPADKPGLSDEPMSPPTVVNQTIVSAALDDVDVPSPYTPGTL